MPNTWDGRDAAEATLVWVGGVLKAAARFGFSTIYDDSADQTGLVFFVLSDEEGDFGPGVGVTLGAFGNDSSVTVVGVYPPITSPFDSGGKQVLVCQGYDAAGAFAKVDFSVKITRSTPEQAAGLVALPTGPVIPFPPPTPGGGGAPDQVLWKAAGGDVTTWAGVMTALAATKDRLDVNVADASIAIPALAPLSALGGRVYLRSLRNLVLAPVPIVSVNPTAGVLQNLGGLDGACKLTVAPATPGTPALSFTPGASSPVLVVKGGAILENTGAEAAILVAGGETLIVSVTESSVLNKTGAGPMFKLAAGAGLVFNLASGADIVSATGLVEGDPASSLTILSDGTVNGLTDFPANNPAMLGSIGFSFLNGPAFTSLQQANNFGSSQPGFSFLDTTEGRPRWGTGSEFVHAGTVLNFYAQDRTGAAAAEIIPPGSALLSPLYLGGSDGPGVLVGLAQYISVFSYKYTGTGNVLDAGTSLQFAIFVNGVQVGPLFTAVSASVDGAVTAGFTRVLVGANSPVPDKVQVVMVPSAPLVGLVTGVAASIE